MRLFIGKTAKKTETSGQHTIAIPLSKIEKIEAVPGNDNAAIINGIEVELTNFFDDLLRDIGAKPE